MYGYDVNNILLCGPVGYRAFIRLEPGHCRWTSLSKKDRNARRQERVVSHNARSTILRAVLVDGAAWETSTDQIVAQLRSKNTFKKKRLGSRAARRFETLTSPDSIVKAEEATSFRALAARANDLALDRPDVAYATKELCRAFASPTKRSILQLKRLVR